MRVSSGDTCMYRNDHPRGICAEHACEQELNVYVHVSFLLAACTCRAWCVLACARVPGLALHVGAGVRIGVEARRGGGAGGRAAGGGRGPPAWAGAAGGVAGEVLKLAWGADTA